MRYIKTFESDQSSHSFVEVDFTGGGDGVHALYIDGDLFKYGDYYHNKINDFIKAFTEGAIWAGKNISFKRIKCVDDDMIRDVSEMADSPPQKLSDVPTNIIK